MAWVFVRLKWRLLANAGASGREEALGWLARAIGLLLAVVGAGDLATAPRHGGAGLVAVFVAVAVAWIMLPLLMGSDRTLAVDRLASLPLRRRDLVLGLFAASLVGAPPLATLVFLSGAVFAYGHGAAATVLAAADVVVMTALAIAGGRAVSAGLAAAVHSRRGRDLASVVLAVVSAGGYIAWRASAALAAEVDSLRPSRLTDALSWTPPGALARSMVDAHAGALPAATGRLAYGIATLVVVGWLWAHALGRQLTNPAATAPRGGERRSARTPRRRLSTPGGGGVAEGSALPVADPGAARERDHGRRHLGLRDAAAADGAGRTSSRSPGLRWPFFLMSNLSANLFGVDGEGFGAYVLTGVDPRTLLRSKALAVATVVGAIAVVACVAGAAVSGAWVRARERASRNGGGDPRGGGDRDVRVGALAVRGRHDHSDVRPCPPPARERKRGSRSRRARVRGGRDRRARPRSW